MKIAQSHTKSSNGNPGESSLQVGGRSDRWHGCGNYQTNPIAQCGKRKGERVQGRRGARIPRNGQFYETNPIPDSCPSCAFVVQPEKLRNEAKRAPVQGFKSSRFKVVRNCGTNPLPSPPSPRGGTPTGPETRNRHWILPNEPILEEVKWVIR
jgi:hypothetical protein